MQIEENTLYWCKTEKLAQEFLQECDQQGYFWRDRTPALSCTMWDINKENTYYAIKSYLYNKNMVIVYGDITYFEFDSNIRRKIVEYKGNQERFPIMANCTLDNDTVTVTLSDGSTGTAKCYLKDKFNLGVGISLAVQRAYGIEDKQNKTEEKKFLPHLQYSNENYTNIGKKTDIVDYLGNQLKIGDTVLIYQDQKRYMESVLCNDNNQIYIRGFKLFEWGRGYTYTNRHTYHIIKDRSYKDIKNGEDINGVKYILEESV